MSDINANIVVTQNEITITATNDEIVITPNPLNMNIFTNDSAPGGFPGDLQYNANGLLGGIPTANYISGNLSLGNSDNLKIAGGSNAYFLQTDGTGNLTWAPGTANVSGNGTSAGANNQIQLTDGSGNFKSAPGFTLDTASNLFSAPGNAYFESNVTADYYFGNGAFLTGIDTSLISNGNSNVRVFANSDVTISISGVSNRVNFNNNFASFTNYGIEVANNVGDNKNIYLNDGRVSVINENQTLSILSETFNNSSQETGELDFYRARGNGSSPAAVLSNDIVSNIRSYVYADAGNTNYTTGTIRDIIDSNDGNGNVTSTTQIRKWGTSSDKIELYAPLVKVTSNGSNTMTISNSIINITPETVINQSLTLKKDNVGSDLLFIESYNNSNIQVNGIETRRYRGNTGNPLTVQNGDEIYSIDHRAQYTNGSFNQSTLAGSNTVVTAVNANGNMSVNTTIYANYTNSNLILDYSNIAANGNVLASRFISNVTTGTSPISVQSITVVANLNANLLNGFDTSTNNTANTIAVRDSNGNINANYFIGNGAFLTGIDTSLISNGNSNVRTFANSNVTISSNGVANVVVVTDTDMFITGNLNANAVKTDNLQYANGTPYDFEQPGGSNTNIQFNDSDDFGGSNAFTFDKSSNVVTINGQLTLNNNSIVLGSNNTANGNLAITVGPNNAIFGNNAIVIGSNNSSNSVLGGHNSIVIGRNTDKIANNTIILNATGVTLDATNPNTVYIKPIPDNPNTAPANRLLYYNTFDGAVLSGPIPTVANATGIANGTASVLAYSVGAEIAFTTGVGGVNSAIFSNTLYTFNRPLKFTPLTLVSSLGNAVTLGAGTRAFVNDANTTTFNAIVGGGGGNNIPVFSDGTNWRVG